MACIDSGLAQRVRLSANTSQPSFASRSASCDPTYPAPAISTREPARVRVDCDSCGTGSGIVARGEVLCQWRGARFAITRLDHAAECLDDLASDYETAPFVGVLDRLIVNHMRWRTARALEAADVAGQLERRCRRFGRRVVTRAERRLLSEADRSIAPEPVRWWNHIALDALVWWRENRRP